MVCDGGLREPLRFAAGLGGSDVTLVDGAIGGLTVFTGVTIFVERDEFTLGRGV
jgi:hypothetical protein